MQTQEQQDQTNTQRLSAYFAKLNESQRQRSLVAEKVHAYGKNFQLDMAHAGAAIRIALKKLETGSGVTEACEAGINAALLIARASSNQRIPCIRKRWAGPTQRAA